MTGYNKPAGLGAKYGTDYAEEFRAEAAKRRISMPQFLALRAAGHLQPSEKAAPPARVAIRPSLPLFRIRVLDAAGARLVDPMLRDGILVYLAAPWTTKQTVSRAGKKLLELEPTDAGQEAVNLSWSAYAAICEGLGHRDDPEALTTEWRDEAELWRGAALDGAPEGPMAEWRGEGRAREAMIADRVRSSFLCAAAPTGLPSLWPLGQDARRLADARAAREAEKQRAEAEAEKARIERERPHSPRELRAVCIEVRTGAASPPAELLELLRIVPVAWTTETAQYVLLAAEPGVPVPVLDTESFRIVPPDDAIIPGHPWVHADDKGTAGGFQIWLLERAGLPVNSGPIALEAFVSTFDADDEALFAEAARDAFRGLSQRTWAVASHLERIVRGRLVYPEIAAHEVWRRMEESRPRKTYWRPVEGPVKGARTVQMRGGGVRHEVEEELPSAARPDGALTREDLERNAVQCAKDGVILPGSLRKDVAHIPYMTQVQTKKKANRS